MSKTKFKLIIAILALIIFISSSFITLDWARFFVIKEDIIYNRFIYTYISKFLIVILTAILVSMIGKDGISKKDTNMLKLIYVFIVLADIALGLLMKPFLGIFLFSIVQISLIYRNGNELFSIIKNNGFKLILGNLVINTILSTILLLLIISDIISNMLNEQLLFYIMIFYASLISISLWTAVANMSLNIFPKLNSRLITFGMVSFVLCDLNVGLSFVLNRGTLWLIADSLIWIFYTLALTLIALSGYDERRLLWKKFI